MIQRTLLMIKAVLRILDRVLRRVQDRPLLSVEGQVAQPHKAAALLVLP